MTLVDLEAYALNLYKLVWMACWTCETKQKDQSNVQTIQNLGDVFTLKNLSTPYVRDTVLVSFHSNGWCFAQNPPDFVVTAHACWQWCLCVKHGIYFSYTNRKPN